MAVAEGPGYKIVLEEDWECIPDVEKTMHGVVTCMGVLVLDVFLKPVVSLPAADKLELIDRFEIHCGGCTNNTAIRQD